MIDLGYLPFAPEVICPSVIRQPVRAENIHQVRGIPKRGQPGTQRGVIEVPQHDVESLVVLTGEAALDAVDYPLGLRAALRMASKDSCVVVRLALIGLAAD